MQRSAGGMCDSTSSSSAPAEAVSSNITVGKPSTDGLTIIFFTFVRIAALIFVVWASERGLEALNELYNDTGEKEHVTAKILLLTPYILLFIWVLILQIVIFASALASAADFANRVRNWWHKAPKGS